MEYNINWQEGDTEVELGYRYQSEQVIGDSHLLLISFACCRDQSTVKYK